MTTVRPAGCSISLRANIWKLGLSPLLTISDPRGGVSAGQYLRLPRCLKIQVVKVVKGFLRHLVCRTTMTAYSTIIERLLSSVRVKRDMLDGQQLLTACMVVSWPQLDTIGQEVGVGYPSVPFPTVPKSEDVRFSRRQGLGWSLSLNWI